MSATIFYALEEIKKNNGKDGNRIWIIYKDSVFDVTDYVENHPGGAELVTDWAGKDCTKAFDDFGHSSDAIKELKTYKIGELTEEDRVKKGQKKPAKIVTDSKPSDKPETKSCLNIITCGLLG